MFNNYVLKERKKKRKMISFFVVWANEVFTHEPSNPNLGCHRINTEYVEEK